MALGLGLAACQRGLSVGFTTAASLVHELIEARDERRLLNPPEEAGTDQASWTLKLLADQLVECEIVETISTETVRQALKKTN